MTALRAPQSGAVCPGGAHGAPTEAGAISGLSPQVDLVKQGDKVVRIVVTCTCGERTEIECLYPPGL